MSEFIRHAIQEARGAMRREAAIVLIGPRQVGKTTLAHQIAEERDAIYLDLESPSDLARLSNTEQFLEAHSDKLVILDEIHRVPALFETLRGVIDRGRRAGKGVGRFLLLGSASIDLMRQSETLAGRIEYLELGPLGILEVGGGRENTEKLWLRGGFPRSFLAESDNASFRWRENFVRTFLERDVPMFGFRLPAERLGRLWIMLAHNQSQQLNATKLGSNLGITTPTSSHYVSVLEDLLLVRKLPPFIANTQKRLVKTPKTIIRDSGLVHALLGIETMHGLLGHPVVGASWEGFVIETLLSIAPFNAKASFYRTSAGAEIDLILDLGGEHGLWAIEIKRTTAPKVEKGFRNSLADVKPARAFLIHSGEGRFPMSDGVEALPLEAMCQELAALRGGG